MRPVANSFSNAGGSEDGLGDRSRVVAGGRAATERTAVFARTGRCRVRRLQVKRHSIERGRLNGATGKGTICAKRRKDREQHPTLPQAQPGFQLRRIPGNHEPRDGTAWLTAPGLFMSTHQ